MDIYRLEHGGAADLGLEEYFEGDGVSVVEWPQFLGVAMPEAYLLVQITKDPADDAKRIVKLTAHGAKYQALAAIR